MAGIFHDGGESWILQRAFSLQQTAPTSTFGLGLASDTLVEADRISDIIGEPYGTESGYSRALIAASSVGFTITQTDPSWQALLPVTTYTASGNNMGVVNRWFLTNEGLSGELGGSAELIGSGDIDPARTVNDGDSIAVTAYLQVR